MNKLFLMTIALMCINAFAAQDPNSKSVWLSLRAGDYLQTKFVSLTDGDTNMAQLSFSYPTGKVCLEIVSNLKHDSSALENQYLVDNLKIASPHFKSVESVMADGEHILIRLNYPVTPYMDTIQIKTAGGESFKKLVMKNHSTRGLNSSVDLLARLAACP